LLVLYQLQSRLVQLQKIIEVLHG